MQNRQLGQTGLAIPPLVLGTNVFGWTIDERQSFAVLDAAFEHGFTALDTADSYSTWVPGNKGGESETIIGNWLAANPDKRDRVTVITKVGSDMGQGHKDLSPAWILKEVEASLKRLQTDRIDLYFSHWHDPQTPTAETLQAYRQLLERGQIRAIGASNHDAGQLAEALKIADEQGLPRYQAVQPEYNLYDRAQFEGPLRALAIREGLGVITYFSLASGFLSGKYRSRDDFGKSQRGGGMEKYLDAKGVSILDVLDRVSGAHGAQPADVALAWLMAKEGVTAPIASATKVSHIEGFARAVQLALSAQDMRALDEAGR